MEYLKNINFHLNNHGGGKMSTKNVILGGSAIIAILLIGALVVTATIVQFGISEQEAISIATGAVQGTVQEVELENVNSNLIYEIEIIKDGKEFEVSVDSKSGEIIDIEQELTKEESLIFAASASVSEDEAIEIAEDELSSKFDLEEVETGRYRGVKVWEVEFESNSEEAEVIIDMETGEVLDIEYEDLDDDDD